MQSSATRDHGALDGVADGVQPLRLARGGEQAPVDLVNLFYVMACEPEVEAFLEEAVDTVRALTGSEFAGVLELRREEDSLRLVAGSGWEEGHVGATSVANRLGSQAGYTLLAERPVVVEDLDREGRFVGCRLLREHRVASGITVKIHSGGRHYGVLGTHCRCPRQFSQIEANWMQAVARMIGAVLDQDARRSRLAAAEAQTVRDRERMRFMSRAGSALSAVSASRQADAAGVLLFAARLGAQEIADWCLVDVIEDDDLDQPAVVRAGTAGPLGSEGGEATARALGDRRQAYDPSAPRGPHRVIHSWEAERLAEVDEEALRDLCRDGRQLEDARSLGVASYMCVPLVGHRRIIGAMTFVSASPERAFDAEDLEMAKYLAQQAATAASGASGGPVAAREEAAEDSGKIVDAPKDLEAAPDAPFLTERQMEVLVLLGREMKAKQIKQLLGISENTVRDHIRGAMVAFGARSQLEAVLRAQKAGLI